MSYKIYDFAHAKFSKAYLKSLPKYHLSFLVASSLAANDISVFAKLMNGYSHSDIREITLAQISSLHHWAVRRVFSAKMMEFVKLFDDYALQLRRSKKPENIAHAQKLEQEISAIKGAKEYSFAVDLRNSATNHYIPRDLIASIDRYPDSVSFDMYWHGQPGNCFFPLGEEIAHLTYFDKDPSKGMDLIGAQNWLHKTAGDLIGLHYLCVNFILAAHPMSNYRKKTLLVDNALVSEEDDRLPILFFSGNSSRV